MPHCKPQKFSLKSFLWNRGKYSAAKKNSQRVKPIIVLVYTYELIKKKKTKRKTLQVKCHEAYAKRFTGFTNILANFILVAAPLLVSTSGRTRIFALMKPKTKSTTSSSMRFHLYAECVLYLLLHVVPAHYCTILHIQCITLMKPRRWRCKYLFSNPVSDWTDHMFQVVSKAHIWVKLCTPRWLADTISSYRIM